MEAILTYLWKSALILTLFYGFYKYFLSKETYFNSIRGYLLSGIALAAILPFIIIPIYTDIVPVQFTETSANVVTNSINIIPQSSLSIPFVLVYTYLITTAILLMRFMFQLASVVMLILNNRKKKVDNYYYVETNSETSPFSFFNYIIYNSNQFNEHELKQILAHEKVHASQKHSFDTLLSNLLIVVQWYNPFAWLYKKEIEQNLEFIADHSAQEIAHSQTSYQQLLLKTSVRNYQVALVNNFYNSLLKQRIIMLHKKRSNSKSQWKIALMIPLLLAFIFSFNTEVIAQKEKRKMVKIKVEVFAMLITKKSSKDDLNDLVKSFAEKGLNVKFSNVKRNSAEEIIAINIDAKAKSGKAAASYASDKKEGINEIQISFDNENNNLSIGSGESHGMHNYSFSENGLTKVIKHRVHKKGDNTFIYSDDDSNEHSSTKIWLNEDGDTTKIKTRKMIIEIDGDHDGEKLHEIIINDEEGTEKEVIKIKNKKGDGKGNFVFISEDDDDENTTTTYIINGKKMSKEVFKKMDPDKIKTIEIKKEVKKEK